MKRGIKKFISGLNDAIADKLSFGLSTMVAFYLVLALVIIPLFYGTPTTLVAWASYLCSVVFQGIALPVLGYTAKKSGDKADKMMKEMFRMTKEIDKLVKHMEQQQNSMDAEIDEILNIEKEKH